MMVISESDANIVLDANAAVGVLQEIFVGDATIARIQCAPHGGRAEVHPLRRRPDPGCPHGARPVARHGGLRFSEHCADLATQDA